MTVSAEELEVQIVTLGNCATALGDSLRGGT